MRSSTLPLLLGFFTHAVYVAKYSQSGVAAVVSIASARRSSIMSVCPVGRLVVKS